MLCSDTLRPVQSVPMSIDIEKRDGVCILHCRGRFVSGPDLEYMQNKLEEIKDMNCHRVLADFQSVTSIGSMGVGFLVGLFTSVVRRAGGRFVLTGAKPLVLHVLELTRLDTVIPLRADLASGLTMLRAAESAKA